MFRPIWRWIPLVLILAVGVVPTVADDEEPVDSTAETQDAEPSDAPTEPSDEGVEEGTPELPEEEPAEPAEPAAGSATEEFNAQFELWKDLLTQLRLLQEEYRQAEPTELDGIIAEFQELIGQGEEMIGGLRVAALAAYGEAPNEDEELVSFLLQLTVDDIAADRYESAAEVTDVLIEHGCEVTAVHNLAAKAYFCINDYDRAGEQITLAIEAGVSDAQVAEYQAVLEEYRTYWERESELRAAEAEANDLPRVKLVTEVGDIVIELYENEAPQTVGNFIHLVEEGFYNGLTFHRVLQGFMAQGGCPDGTGGGGPGYEIYCECGEEAARMHFRGTLSMAHAGENTGGSQFFITFVPTSQLNARHTAFGRVIEGLDVLSEIQLRDPSARPPLPVPTQIISAEVLRKREHEYLPTKVEDE